MPAVQNFTREKILDAALEVVESLGGDELSVRRVAKAMGGSTQPIYREFGNFAALEQALFLMANQRALEFMTTGERNHGPFLHIGVRYIDFAMEHPRLFAYLFTGRGWDQAIMAETLGQLARAAHADPHLAPLPVHTVERLTADMWLYTHGLLTSQGFTSAHVDRQKLIATIDQLGTKLVTYELMKLQGTIPPFYLTNSEETL